MRPFPLSEIEKKGKRKLTCGVKLGAFKRCPHLFLLFLLRLLLLSPVKETTPYFDHEKLVAYRRRIELVAWSTAQEQE